MFDFPDELTEPESFMVGDHDDNRPEVFYKIQLIVCEIGIP